MDDVWKGAIIGTLMGFPGALYSSVVLHRWNKFVDLKWEARRLVDGLEFIGSEGDVRIEEKKDLGELVSLAGEFRRRGHATMADELLSLFSDIRRACYEMKNGEITLKVFSDSSQSWLLRLNRVGPSYLAILHPNIIR